MLHDTFAKEGRAAFPGLPYLAPDGFTKASGIPTEPLGSPPSDWKDEIDVLKLDGNRMNEHALFHRRSATLVVGDLFFSFPRETRGWARFFIRHIMRLPRLFGISVFFRMTIGDRHVFKSSMKALLQWKFDRLVVAHRSRLIKMQSQRLSKHCAIPNFCPECSKPPVDRSRELRVDVESVKDR